MKRLKRAKFAVIFLAFIFIAMLSLADGLFKNSKHTVCSDSLSSDYSMRYLSIKDKSIEQEIELEGNLQELYLYFVVPDGIDYKNANIELAVVQRKIRYVFQIKAEEIVNGYNKIKEISYRLSDGEAKLTISGHDFPQNTDMFLLLSDEPGTGLKPAVFYDNIMEYPIILKYSILRQDDYFYYDLIFLLLLIAVILVISLVFAYKPEYLQEHERLFFFSFVLLFIYISLKNPLACFLAEPHSEMAYDFWYKAHNMGFAQSMMSLMSGECLVWTERILMYLADRLISRKYVFVLAQLFQLCMICASASLFTLSHFKRYFCDEIRLIISFFCGALLLFPSAYYFWAVSYWVSFFIIPVLFMDMDKFKRSGYVILLIITNILVVSRVYHIVYIPIAAALLLFQGREKGKRFQLYVLDIMAAALFETFYSMMYGGQDHLGGTFQLIEYCENTVYYQVQVLVSIFVGENVKNALMANVLFLGVFIGIITLFIHMAVTNKKGYVCTVGGLGILSVGTIAINVVVCGMSKTVGFAHDYAADVNWNECYYQQGDLHFSYSYLSCVVLFLVILFYLTETLGKNKWIWKKAVNGIIVLFIIHFALIANYETSAIEVVPTDWKHTSYVTDREEYYLPINVSYAFVNISLENNSTGYIYGFNDEGNIFFWNQDKSRYSEDVPIHTAKIGEVSDIEDRKVLIITLRKYNLNFSLPYELVLYDRHGKELTRVKQSNDPRRIWMDFILDNSLQGVYSFSVFDVEGNEAYICDGIQIGVEDQVRRKMNDARTE